MSTRTAAAGLAIAALALALAGCGGNSSNSENADPASAGNGATTNTTRKATASTDWAVIHAAIPTTKLTATVTAANDGNHLLGRPHQYTSAIKFADSRIKPSDVEGLDPDDVTRGGGIEVFANHDDAQARADYIQKVTKGIPALSEYDYVSGDAVVRVSYLLTPTQAGEYKAAAQKLG